MKQNAEAPCIILSMMQNLLSDDKTTIGKQLEVIFRDDLFYVFENRLDIKN